MTASTSTYLALVPSENASKPNLTAAIAALCQPFVDEQNQFAYMMGAFNLDTAVGVQLDAVGQWIGISRALAVPLPNVYFSFDTSALGWDQGTWQGPNDSSTGQVSLADDAYRTLLRAKIGLNTWDGTMASLVTILNEVFVGSAALIFVTDNQNMTISVSVAGPLPTAVQLALLRSGLVVPCPSGVMMNYFVTSINNTPLFGFDIESSYISGWDVGSWGH